MAKHIGGLCTILLVQNIGSESKQPNECILANVVFSHWPICQDFYISFQSAKIGSLSADPCGLSANPLANVFVGLLQTHWALCWNSLCQPVGLNAGTVWQPIGNLLAFI